MSEPSTHSSATRRNCCRKLLVDSLGSATAALAGAGVGSLVPADMGLAYLCFICVCAGLGWMIWIRRRKPWRATVLLCVAVLVMWVFVAYLLRELERVLF